MFDQFLQVRHHDLKKDEDRDEILSFLVPVLADDKRLKAQVFVSGHKRGHNMICESHLKITNGSGGKGISSLKQYVTMGNQCTIGSLLL